MKTADYDEKIIVCTYFFFFLCKYCRYADNPRSICNIILHSYQNQCSINDLWNRLSSVFVGFLHFSNMFQVLSMWF
jgi:hypothetical protein